ncbi:MAG: hypothetical protein JWO50_647 [Candidatus Kaiserbacteria bacterium]|nr:hypothetical protein [Candidatus Kaiserbacteria bacterium]
MGSGPIIVCRYLEYTYYMRLSTQSKYKIFVLAFCFLAILALVAVAYAVWYSYERHEKLVQSEVCKETLANPAKPTMVKGPDGNPAPLYTINGCTTVVVPPTLWNLIRGRMVFDNVPNRMKVNPYSFSDILRGSYTFGPTDIVCDQSATTTDCSQFGVTLKPPIDRAALAQEALTRLQANIKNVTPHFVDVSRLNSQSLTPEESEIKDDIIGVFITENPGESEDYYSTIWLIAVGKRYILASKPMAESSYDEIIDSQTGKVTIIPGESRYYLASSGRNTALYIDYQAIRTYALDAADAVIVPGSQLSGNETYHSGTSDAYLASIQTHTKNSIDISIFDSSQIVQNPDAQPNAMQTMNKKIRTATFLF